MRLIRNNLTYRTPECPACAYRIWVKTTLDAWRCNRCGTPATPGIIDRLMIEPPALPSV